MTDEKKIETNDERAARLFGSTEEEQRLAVTLLQSELRGWAMLFASQCEELEELARRAERASDASWIINPTLARDRSAQIARHVELTERSASYARAMRRILDEELRELRELREKTRQETGL